MNKFMQRNFPFDPATAFAPVSLLAESALFLAVNPALPVNNVGEFIDYAKRNPGKLAYGSAGVGSAHHIAGELLKQKTGIDMVHVPYPGGGPAIQDLITNHISVAFGTAPAVLPQFDAGNMRVLATTRATRLPDRPSIPTISETVPGVETVTWLGLFAPSNTPQPIIDKLNKATREVLADPRSHRGRATRVSRQEGGQSADLWDVARTQLQSFSEGKFRKRNRNQDQLRAYDHTSAIPACHG